MARTFHTTESFIEKCKKVHNNFYTYEKTIYVKSNDKVIITCPNHGDFEQRARAHSGGFKCSKCMADSYKVTQESFVEKANIKHNNYFDYSKTVYEHGDLKVTITCPVHGDFLQMARKHLEGRGCVKCSRTKTSLLMSRECNTFTRDGFINKAGNSLTTLYVLNCYNESENFYKIGITTRTVKKTL